MRFNLRRVLALLALPLAAVFLFLAPSLASAQETGTAEIIPLSGSGYDRAHALAYSSDGRYLAVGGISGVYLFDPQERQAARPATGFLETGAWARSLAFLPETHTLAVALFDGTIQLWDVPNAHLIRTLEGHQGWVRNLGVSGDGSLLVSASDDDTLRVWDLRSGAALRIIDRDTAGIRAAALSPDGRLAAGALSDNTVHVWDLQDGSLLYTLRGHTDWPRCLAFSPDGRLLASGAFDKTVRLWDMADGSLARTLAGHSSSVLGVAFSPDGERLASASVDGTVRVWQVREGISFSVLHGHRDFVYAVAFSPDGKTLASGAGDNSVRLWSMEEPGDTPPGEIETEAATPSDCRACHHRRDTFEPARVIELSCEGCHAGGASLAWCANFPQTGFPETEEVAYAPAIGQSGVPVGGPEIAVVVISPGNGETLYVEGALMAPVTIRGKVYFPDAEAISQVRVELQILSSGNDPFTQVTYPSGNGEFHFAADTNQGAPPAQPVTLLCRGCHENAGYGFPMPVGEVHLIVTATAPGGERAVDERWFQVDSSGEAVLPVQVQDAVTGEPVPGVIVQASTVLYEWRGRNRSALTDDQGVAHLKLESLSQARTEYRIGLPAQVARGQSYSSVEQPEVVLEPGKTAYPLLTLRARGQAGRLTGRLSGEGLPSIAEDAHIWAFQLPSGPARSAALEPGNTFTFQELPIGEWIIFADPLALARTGLRSGVEQVNLAATADGTAAVTVSDFNPVRGLVTAQDGGRLPFAWVKAGNGLPVQPVSPLSGEFFVQDPAPEAPFVTVSAPGYYSLARPTGGETEDLDFRLVPGPDLQRMAWGDGVLLAASHSKIEGKGLSVAMEQGWIWGRGGAGQPLRIHLPGVEVEIPAGEFALEYPGGGNAWLYIFSGQAWVTYGAGAPAAGLSGGEMISLSAPGSPIVIEAAVIAALHPALKELPVPGNTEPTLRARLERGLLKAGIHAAQVTTFVTYMAAILALVLALPLFFYRKRKGHRKLVS